MKILWKKEDHLVESLRQLLEVSNEKLVEEISEISAETLSVYFELTLKAEKKLDPSLMARMRVQLIRKLQNALQDEDHETLVFTAFSAMMHKKVAALQSKLFAVAVDMATDENPGSGLSNLS